MDRRDFLKQAGIMGAAVGTGLVSAPNIFENSSHKYYQQLMQSAKSISIYELERIAATRALLFGNNVETLVGWKNQVIKTSELRQTVNEVRQNLINLSLSKTSEFLEEKPKQTEIKELLDYFDSIYGTIDECKKGKSLYFIEKDSKTWLLNDFNYAKAENSPVYEIVEGTPLADRFSFSNFLQWERFSSNEEIKKLIDTLNRLTPESCLFIRKASEAAKVSLEEAVALGHIESGLREFALSNTALGVLQINFNPKVIRYNYPNAISVDNELSDYISRNTSKSTIIENLVSNMDLNTAFGLNLYDFKKRKLNQDYVAAAYNIGIEAVGELPGSVKYKLRHPKKITQFDLNHHKKYKYLYRYQKGFISARDNFVKLQGANISKA